MLVDIYNPTGNYPFYNVPDNSSQAVLDAVHNIKYIQLAIQLKKDISSIALYMIAGSSSTLLFQVVIDDNSFLVTYNINSNEFFTLVNEVFNIIPTDSNILFSENINASFSNTKIEVLPEAFVFYPMQIEIEMFSKKPSKTASQNTAEYESTNKALFECSVFSGFNCQVQYINHSLVLNSFTSAGKGIITLLSTVYNDITLKDLLQLKKLLEGIYTINGIYGNVDINVGNSVFVLYTNEDKDLLQIHFLLPKTEEDSK